MANTLRFQSDWLVHQANAWAGLMVSQPGSMVISGALRTPTGGVIPRPGYPVYYNPTSDRWEVPTTAENIANIAGILLYRKSDIVNESGVIEYANDTIADILFRGAVWVEAGGAINPLSRITWDNAARDWVVSTENPVSEAADITANTAAAINAGLDDVVGNVNAALGTFRRINCLSPMKITDGSLFEAYLQG